MDFRLKVFKTVAERLSFTKASKELFISQPAISKHIRQLEEHFGQALFTRDGKTIRLTPEGEMVLEYTNQILELYGRLESEFQAAEGKFPDKITIGASTTISQYVLPKLLIKLKAAHHATQVGLVNGNSEKIESIVRDREVDLALTEGTTHPGLHFEPFVKDEIVLATRSGNSRPAESRSEYLSTLPMLFRETGSGTRHIIESALESRGISLRDLKIEMVLGSSESMKTYLMHSDVFAFISIHAIAEELRRNELRIVDVADMDITRQFHFVSLHGRFSYGADRVKRFFLERYNLME